MRKILSLLTGLLVIPMLCSATEPYPDQVSLSPDKKITVRLTTRRSLKAAVVIENKDGKNIKEFTDEELLENDLGKYNYTTAGNDWYQNSISFITQNNAFFVVRTRWGKIVIIDLAAKTRLRDIPTQTRDEIQDTIIQKALELLDSAEPENIETGAIACGQLQTRQAIPRLRSLLKDKNYYTTNIPEEWTRVYYVRKAAKEALENLGENIKNITIEEPDKPRPSK